MLNYAKDLFQLQNELVEAKINIVANQKLGPVTEKLNELKNQMNKDMKFIITYSVDLAFSHVNKRLFN